MAITIKKPKTLKAYLQPTSHEPKFYLLSILNDKYISWEFCMKILQEVFHKSLKDAQILSQQIVTDGEALCGGYTLEIAETKAELIEKEAKNKGFTLLCLIEEV